MKKLIALVVCLLCLAPCALAESAPYTLDAGYFTMQLYPGDVLELYDRTDNQSMLFLYPPDTGDMNYMDNINIVWTQQDSSSMTQDDLDVMADFIIEQAQAQYTQLGVDADNFEVLGTELEPGVKGAILYSFDMDLTPLGSDLQTTLYQYQAFIMDGAEGTYIITLSSDSFDSLSLMYPYTDTFTLK